MAATAPEMLPTASVVLAAPLGCLSLIGIFLQWEARQIYKRIDDFSIGVTTFNWQLAYPGCNFPGPNVLEAKIAARPQQLQTDIRLWRDRRRRLNLAFVSYVGFLVALGVAVTLVRKLNA
jgi:hypothetical protein